LRVAQALGEIRRRLVAPLRVGRAPDLFHEPELARLVSELRDEAGRAQHGVDAVGGHRCVEMGQIEQRLVGADVRHDLAKLGVGDHGLSFGL